MKLKSVVLLHEQKSFRNFAIKYIIKSHNSTHYEKITDNVIVLDIGNVAELGSKEERGKGFLAGRN